MGNNTVDSEQVKLTGREIDIMNEAFTIGRIYAISGEQETPSEIQKKLENICKAHVSGRNEPTASEVRLKRMVSDNEGGLSKEARAAIRWLHSPIAQTVKVKKARETIEQVWGKEVSEEIRQYTQA